MITPINPNYFTNKITNGPTLKFGIFMHRTLKFAGWVPELLCLCPGWKPTRLKHPTNLSKRQQTRRRVNSIVLLSCWDAPASGFARAVKESGIPRSELFICGSVVSNRASGFDAAKAATARGCEQNMGVIA